MTYLNHFLFEIVSNRHWKYWKWVEEISEQDALSKIALDICDKVFKKKTWGMAEIDWYFISDRIGCGAEKIINRCLK